MNINKFIGNLDTNSRTRNEQLDAKSNTVSSKSKGTEQSNFGDQVNLSSSVKNIQQVEAEIRAMPEIDDSTVERIRNAINSGEYKIDYEKLAGKMLNFEDTLK